MTQPELSTANRSEYVDLQIGDHWVRTKTSTVQLQEFCTRFKSEQPVDLTHLEKDSRPVDQDPDILIVNDQQGLELAWLTAGGKPLLFRIEVEKLLARQYSFPAAKQGPLNQALGKRSKKILDVTAGWGGDALLMCTQGYQLTLIERNPVMSLLLKDAMARLVSSTWAVDNQVAAPEVHEGNALEFLRSMRELPDCIYLDPMFPPKRKKSAAANKHMQFLQWLVGADIDASELCQAAIDSGVARVVVKRPEYANPLVEPPSQVFSGKLVHYDVYLRS
ncbi:MAG: class I SAM-dependent methyltransferase [Pseudomonadota bacterium]